MVMISLQNLRKDISKEVKSLVEANQIENSDRFHATAAFLTGSIKRQLDVHYSHNQKKIKPTHRVEATEMKSRLCIYCCTEDHFPGDCKKVKDASRRFDILKQTKLCFHCYGKPRASECKSRNMCKKCRKYIHMQRKTTV